MYVRSMYVYLSIQHAYIFLSVFVYFPLFLARRRRGRMKERHSSGGKVIVCSVVSFSYDQSFFRYKRNSVCLIVFFLSLFVVFVFRP